MSLNDQVKLIQSSIYPIELLNMSKVFDPVTKKYNYFTYTEEEEMIMMEQFPMLRVFQVMSRRPVVSPCSESSR